jgi:hypothetical protein
MALVNTSLLMKEIETLPPSRLEEDAAFEARLKAKRSVPETMLLSEASLAKDWDTPEEDAAWAALRRQPQPPKQ